MPLESTLGPDGYTVQPLKPPATSGLSAGELATVRKSARLPRQAGTRAVNPVITDYQEDGTTYLRYMPPIDKIIQKGRCLWSPTPTGGAGAPGANAAYTNEAYTGVGQIIQSEVSAGDTLNDGIVLLTALSAGQIDCAWTVTAPFAPPTYRGKFLMDILLHTELGNAFGGGVDVIITGANGGIARYKFNASCFAGGLNTVRLWDPNSALHNTACVNGTVSYISGTPTWDFVSNIVGIRLVVQGAVQGARLRFFGAWQPTIVKTQLCFNFEISDVSGADISGTETAVNRFLAEGFGASVRAGANASNRSISNRNAVDRMYKAGAAVYNGSWSRAGLNGGSTEALVRQQVGLNAAYLASNGWTRGADWFSTIANNTAARGTMRKACVPFGVRRGKTGSGFGNVVLCGAAGIDDPLQLRAVGYGGRSLFQAQVLAAIEVGAAAMIPFSHAFPTYTGALPVPDAPAPDSGGGTWMQDLDAIIPFLRALVDAGEIDVVDTSQLSLYLDGIGY